MASKKLPRFLTWPEFRKMLESCEKRDAMVLQTFFFTGLRNNELRCLKVEDIDLANRELKVEHGKGDKQRNVPIPMMFINTLTEWIAGRDKGFLFEGGSRDGTLSNTQIRRIVKSCAKKANIRKWWEVHPHSMRHGYATYLRNREIPLEVIQEILGHERLETTRIYAHLAKDQAKKSVDKAFSD